MRCVYKHPIYAAAAAAGWATSKQSGQDTLAAKGRENTRPQTLVTKSKHELVLMSQDRARTLGEAHTCEMLATGW